MKRLLYISLSILLLFSISACGTNVVEPPAGASGTEAVAVSQAPDSGGDSYVITGLVFSDDNGNGIFDSGESGLEGVLMTGGGNSARTDSSGKFRLSAAEGSIEISVDEDSLGGTYVLTTGNSVQTIEISGGAAAAEDIGYAPAGASGISFSDALETSADITNYHFILEITTEGLTDSLELWVMDSNMKSAAQGQVIYYNQTDGTMGVYLEATNQLVVSPITETTAIETPFTLAEEIDMDTYGYYTYKGTQELDGKTVYVFESAAPDFSATYYVWSDTGIIIKMETSNGGNKASYFFKDLSIGNVTDADFAYPAGAEVVDLGSFGDMGDGGFELPDF